VVVTVTAEYRLIKDNQELRRLYPLLPRLALQQLLLKVAVVALATVLVIKAEPQAGQVVAE
jgi:hypothetical protein